MRPGHPCQCCRAFALALMTAVAIQNPSIAPSDRHSELNFFSLPTRRLPLQQPWRLARQHRACLSLRSTPPIGRLKLSLSPLHSAPLYYGRVGCARHLSHFNPIYEGTVASGFLFSRATVPASPHRAGAAFAHLALALTTFVFHCCFRCQGMSPKVWLNALSF